MQIIEKNIENEKNIKIMHISKLHDRFPDFDFGEDTWEDHKNSLQSSY